jgi:hypothetical protein
MALVPYTYPVVMVKTTVYLPEQLKRRLERAASLQSISEAEFIRTSLENSVGASRPLPKGGIVQGNLAHAIDWESNEHLAGFGEK